MITSKQTRCQRFCWAYVTKYPYVSGKDIAGAQTDYSHAEVLDALIALAKAGFIKRSGNATSKYYQWQPVIPFVVSVPEWAV